MPPQNLARPSDRPRPAPAILALATTILLVHSAVPAAAGSQRRSEIATKTLSVGRAEILKLEFPAGQCTIVGSEDSQVRFTVWVKCKSRNDDECLERAERIDVRAEHDGDAISLSVEDYPKIQNGFHLEALLEVPDDLALDVDMGAGELKIEHVGADLDAQLGAGELEVRMDESSVRSVDVQVGIGDASLKRPGRDHAGRGWLGKQLHWDDGPGRSRVRIDVGVGEGSVRLD